MLTLVLLRKWSVEKVSAWHPEVPSALHGETSTWCSAFDTLMLRPSGLSDWGCDSQELCHCFLAVSHPARGGKQATSRESSLNVVLNSSSHKITLRQTLPWVGSTNGTQGPAVPKYHS